MSDCVVCSNEPLILNAWSNADFILPIKASDFSGATFSSKLKAADGSLIATCAIVTPSSVATDTFDLKLTAATLGAIASGTYFFDVLATQGGTISRLFAGQLVLNKGIT